MKIYKITPDFDCHSLQPSDSENYLKIKPFGLKAITEIWPESMQFYIRYPLDTKQGDILHLAKGGLAIKKSLLETDIGELLNYAGEILDISIETINDSYVVLNPLQYFNCLDRDNSEFRTTPDGSVVVEIFKYSFFKDRIGFSDFFKIPETHMTSLYTATPTEEDPEDKSFYSLYHELGLIGIKFKEVWSDEN